MAYIKNKAVARTIKNLMQRNRKLNRAEIGRKMTARGRYHRDQALTDLGAKLQQLAVIKRFEIGGSIYFVQKFAHISSVLSAKQLFCKLRKESCSVAERQQYIASLFGKFFCSLHGSRHAKQ